MPGATSRALALRWATSALGLPHGAPQLWPDIALLLDACTRLQPVGGVSEEVAYGGGSSSLLKAALGGLSANVTDQRAIAAIAIDQLAVRCVQLFQEEHADASGCTSMLMDDSSYPPSQHTLRSENLRSLLFSILPVIRAPLLPVVQQAARRVVLGSGYDARCTLQLRQAISAAAAGPRKQLLVNWLIELPRALSSLACADSPPAGSVQEQLN